MGEKVAGWEICGELAICRVKAYRHCFCVKKKMKKERRRVPIAVAADGEHLCEVYRWMNRILKDIASS